jgi:RHS repeat-associated protein
MATSRGAGRKHEEDRGANHDKADSAKPRQGPQGPGSSGEAVDVAPHYQTKSPLERPIPPSTSYYGYDAHGNIVFLTDSTGAVTDSYDYDAWGVLVSRVGLTPNSRLYAGEEFDGDLGLINLRARYLDLRSGRFTSIDPDEGNTRHPVTFNRYLYSGADPVRFSDPSGRFVEEGLLYEAEVLAVTGPRVVVVSATGAATGLGASALPIAFVGYIGYKTACNFWKGWSALELIEAAQEGRAQQSPPTPFQMCQVDMICTLVTGGPGWCSYECPNGQIVGTQPAPGEGCAPSITRPDTRAPNPNAPPPPPAPWQPQIIPGGK